MHKWSYLARTVPDNTRLFQPLEDVIRTKYIPCLTGRAPPNDLERNLLSLPPRLGIPNPTITSDTEYTASRSVCKPLYTVLHLTLVWCGIYVACCVLDSSGQNKLDVFYNTVAVTQ